MRPQLHAGTNLGPPFNRSASSLTPSKTLALWFFSPSCHCSHACSSFSFSSLLFLSLFFCWSTLLCFIPTSPLWLHFNPLILITRFVVSCRSPPLTSFSLQFLPLLPAPVSQVSACLFPPLLMPFFCSLFHLFRHSVPLFTSFCGFSLSTGTRDPITSYCFHLPVSHRLFVLPLDSLSLYTMNPEGFYLFFSPLNGFATLPNPSSPSASLSPSITLSLVLSFPLPLHRPHIHILLFCHPISCAPHHPPISSTILSHFYLLHSLTRNPSSLSPGHSSFSFIPLKPSFFSHFHDRCTCSRHICGRSNLPNAHLYLALYLTSNFSSTISRVDAHLQYWQKTHLRKITRPIIDRAD